MDQPLSQLIADLKAYRDELTALIEKYDGEVAAIEKAVEQDEADIEALAAQGHL